MTILLVGGTGLLGGAIARELAGRGQPVRALVRSGRNTAALRQLGVALEAGDMADPRALRRALRGARAVITTAQGNPLSRQQPMRRIDGAATLGLIEAARQAGVEHFIFVSALKADEGAPHVPQLAYKLAAEQALQASGMAYTILRPSSFQETFGDYFAPFKRIVDRFGVGLTMGSGRGRHSFVAVPDVARAAALALELPQARGQIVPVGGPADLSYREAYRLIRQVTGRRLPIVPIPRLLLSLGGALARPILPELAGFFAFFRFFDRYGYTCETPSWMLDALGERITLEEELRRFFAR